VGKNDFPSTSTLIMVFFWAYFIVNEHTITCISILHQDCYKIMRRFLKSRLKNLWKQPLRVGKDFSNLFICGVNLQLQLCKLDLLNMAMNLSHLLFLKFLWKLPIWEYYLFHNCFEPRCIISGRLWPCFALAQASKRFWLRL
jgi:hypothetical protein